MLPKGFKLGKRVLTQSSSACTPRRWYTVKRIPVGPIGNAGSKSVANLPLKEGLFVKPLSQTCDPVDAALSTGPAVRPCTVAVKLIQGSAIAVSQLAHPMRNTAAKPNAPAAWRTNNFDYTADNVESVCPASFGLHTQAASSPDSSS